MQNGIFVAYDEWTHHGESCDVSNDSDDDDVSFNVEEVGSDKMNGDNDDDDDDDDDADDDLDEILDNIGQGTWAEKWKTSAESSSSIDKDLESLRSLLDDSHQELYMGCQSYSKFSFIVTMLHLKTTNGWSSKVDNRRIQSVWKTQHSGVVVPGNYGINAIDFYGILQEVLEVEYLGLNKRVLVFKCNWFRVSDVRGFQVEKESAKYKYVLRMVHRSTIHSYISSKIGLDLKLGKNWHVVLSNSLRKVFNVPVGDVYQEEEPKLNVNVDLNLEQSSLRRGSTPLELVDGITFSCDSTGKSSKNYLLIDEEYIDDEETDPSDLESSEKEGSSQEDESSQEDYIDSD
ncbi:hypothetical protein Tco_1562050 [Tanacetum coccineum]